VKNSLLKVKNGEVVYERDSVVFNQIEYSWPLLAILQKIAIENNHTLNLIDYGGSLGSSYFQNKDFLANFGNIQWNIVEQKKFVDVGKRYFESEQLSFFYTIEDCIELKESKVIVISNVIQYLESPLEFIQSLIAHKFDYIVFDKTSFVKGESDVITVQIVPPEIYTASYPCRFFNEKNFLKEFENGYSLEYTFDVPIQVNYENSYYKGFVFKRLI
jgi:putative methyltransferase (TIGR04325 family)